jgi:hypothetical protein
MTTNPPRVLLRPPPPPPSVDGRRHPAFYDTECYPNYWLLKLRPLGGVVMTWQLREGQRFTQEQAADIRSTFDGYNVVSFNGRGYDVWMIGAALAGYTPIDLKYINDRIIVGNEKPWEIEGLPRWEPPDHVDVMEVAPGQGGLKQKGGRVHARTMRDLPYPPDVALTDSQIAEVDSYCENDLDLLQHLWRECEPLLQLREELSKRYGMDLRSKSDAQLAEAVLRKRCEQATGQKIYRGDARWQQLQFRVPAFIAYTSPELQHALRLIRESVFIAQADGRIIAPEALDKLTINLGRSSYKVGIGGLHSQEKCVSYRSDESMQLRAPDVASYYPSLILNTGEYPPALGPAFVSEYGAIKAERLDAKERQAKLKKAGDTKSPDYIAAKTLNEGGKIMINGTFGKTGSAYSVLYAPSMLLQTTLTGQLSLLMLIEWHEHYGIPVVSANTDGLVIACPRHLLPTSDWLIKEWERRTGLEMENTDWRALYARDVNNYFAIDGAGDVKRKGEYSKSGLVEKKNPDTEICSDAVAAFLSKGAPLDATIYACADVRKFVTLQQVSGGGVKLWGDGPRKDAKVRDMVPRLEACGWVKAKGAKWTHPQAQAGALYSAADAYATTFSAQRPEYLGKVCRWYYGTNSPGPIVYAARNATVGGSWGATPCMTLPDYLPPDLDYVWYVNKARAILEDVAYRP